VSIEEFDPRVVHEGLLQKQEKNRSRCLTCRHECLISAGDSGICGTRVNSDGIVYTTCYGNVSSLSNNPIEKKPFFHFAPGASALTVGSWGCNASCEFCQNYEISKQPPDPRLTRFLTPKSFVETALTRGSSGTSISFNEAATLMLEWNLEVFQLAHEQGLFNTIVTNGYMSGKALDLLIDAGLDAANVDVKGCKEGVRNVCGLNVDYVWDNVLRMKERGVHFELTTLVVPGLSDDTECLEEIASRILKELGPDTVWHVNRYSPHYRYTAPETPLEVLLTAREMAKNIGLNYVYIGNVWSQGLEDTICPKCGTLCYERQGYNTVNRGTSKEGRCVKCQNYLGIKYWQDQ
jgi:pyruvate formate lyase activating enzyme